MIGTTILLIEDEELVRISTCQVLRRYGYQTLEAANGIEGVKLFEQHRDQIDLVLLDWILPYQSGAETLEFLLNADPTAKIVIFSGHQEGIDCTAATAILTKPINPSELLSRLNEILLNESLCLTEKPN
jgi:two-component system, cell cycle sensor histidine kinase and response regulator CckA